jgi:hypothetical protein
MHIDGHPAPVVGYLDRTVPVDRDIDSAAMPRQRFVHAVVNDLVRKMVRPGRIGVHARATPDGFESTQDLDVLSGIGLAHQEAIRELASKEARGF